VKSRSISTCAEEESPRMHLKVLREIESGQGILPACEIRSQVFMKPDAYRKSGWMVGP
jgi:hypothetical protein